jgi:superfamily I DNA/RNA helicase
MQIMMWKEIVDFISEKHRRIMVVGDDSKSIYAFRGANYENILRFPATYPECVIVKIEENYRSNQKILDFTNSIIANAKIGYKKKLFTKNLRQSPPVIKRVYGQQEEAEFVVDRIMELGGQNIPLNEIAVLNRADWHNRYIQAEMSKRGVPYVVVGGFRFNERMFPSNRAINIEEMEEERRLFYVACSRAKEELYITFPRNIYSYDAVFHLPSRFLVEIDKEKYIFNKD